MVFLAEAADQVIGFVAFFFEGSESEFLEELDNDGDLLEQVLRCLAAVGFILWVDLMSEGFFLGDRE